MLYLCQKRELAIKHVAVRLLASGSRNYSKDHISSEDEQESKKIKIKKDKTEEFLPLKETSIPEEESASSKLNRLLASMQTTDNQFNFVKRSDIVPKPGEGNKYKKLLHKQEVESKDIFAAAKKIASLLGNEKQQQQKTESELLTRLLGGKSTVANSNSKEQKLPSNEGEVSLSELIVGMKIDRRQGQNELTRSEYVRRSIASKGKQHKDQYEFYREKRPVQRKREAEIFTGSVNLTEGEPLGIFTETSILKDYDLLPTWSYLHEQSLKVQISHPPSNYFDKLAKWTEQGKIWRFPIDNEQDWLDEKDVDFTEHVFLEQHLEGWCPKRGPVRHFMELVCVGLSKNPYITAKEKKDHIIWYKNYFESKKDILGELMSNNPKVEKNINDQQQNRVEA